MSTDKLKCVHRDCHSWDDSYEGNCSMEAIKECWDRIVQDDPMLWVMQDIRDEVRRARRKFPHNRHLLGALMEQVGELAQALLQGKSQREIQCEAIQVACVAIRILEERDADYDGWTAEDGKAK